MSTNKTKHKAPSHMKKHILPLLGLVTLLASAAQASQEQLAASIKEARGEATRASEQLKTTLHTLTAGGVKSVKGTVSDANWRYRDVRDAINGAWKEMDKMQKALSPEAK